MGVGVGFSGTFSQPAVVFFLSFFFYGTEGCWIIVLFFPYKKPSGGVSVTG